MTESGSGYMIAVGGQLILLHDFIEPVMQSNASFSRCRTYRYSLMRVWAPEHPLVMFIGLNPSTADERQDDATVRRCIGFAKRWGFGGLVLTNLFAYRSRDPKILAELDDPVGPDNDHWIVRNRRRAETVVAAWGIHGSLLERDRDVLSKISKAQCLGKTKCGSPRHPLYLASNARLREYKI